MAGLRVDRRVRPRQRIGNPVKADGQLSDEPLLTEMQQRLAKNDYRFSVAVDRIVQSRQFREIQSRGAQRAEAQ